MVEKRILCDITGNPGAENIRIFKDREWNGIENVSDYYEIDINPELLAKRINAYFDRDRGNNKEFFEFISKGKKK